MTVVPAAMSAGPSVPFTPGAGAGVGGPGRGPLGRLHIPPPINTGLAGVPVGAFSPAIATARHQAGLPAFPLGAPLQTPLQIFYASDLALAKGLLGHPVSEFST